MKKIIIEAHVPFLKGVFEPYCDAVDYLSAADITPEKVRDTDALIVRTRTKCNANLLDGSNCRFIGTATIGTDHIDFDYCKSHGIEVASAPGCNAPAVEQYVMSVIGNWLADKVAEEVPENLTVGVIGVGHVGELVAKSAENMGFKVLRCDPPRSRMENNTDDFVPLDKILSDSDIITVHTPLIRQGEDATYHLIDNDFILKAKRCKLLINAARGEIADNNALINAPAALYLAIDCWEGEPNLNRALLERAYIATPHIAGYSMEGKLRGSLMMIDAVARHFSLDIDLHKLPQFKSLIKAGGSIDMGKYTLKDMKKVMDSYNPKADTEALKSHPELFESLRNNYNLRHEPAYV
ncbi:MAG: 4-phosphoerythronate dehydrogenase [Muribaculaceae bacterium]|nr:4-phosphoerythronate dehydrogenase [Muribaculaceae bacterium]